MPPQPSQPFHPIPPDPPDSPWRTLNACEVYRNPWLSVVEYQVIRPDGQPGIYGVVDPGDNATIVALDADRRLWLVRDFVYPAQKYCEMLPSGKLEDGEEPLAGAKRELAEEVGAYTAHDEDWTLLGTYFLSPGVSSQRSHIYLARNALPGKERRDGTEQRMTARQLPLREAYTLAINGVYDTAPTALGILLAWARLGASVE